MSFKKDIECFDKLCKYRVRCKCSHTVIMPKTDRIICSYCKNWIYRTPEIEFKYKLQEKIKEMEKKQDNN